MADEPTLAQMLKSWHRQYVQPLGSPAAEQRGPWMRPYIDAATTPGVSDALGRGLMQGLSAIRAPAMPGARIAEPIDPWAPGMRSTADILRNARVGGDRADPANFNGPRQSEFADPVGGRFNQAMDNGGKPPTVDLPTDPVLVQRYLDALTKPGDPAAIQAAKVRRLRELIGPDALELIPGGKP